MEYNKDEAQKCIDIAKKCITLGNYEKAIKFLDKSNRLFPNAVAQNLRESTYKKLIEINTARNRKEASSNSGSSKSDSNSNTNSTRSRQSSSSNTNTNTNTHNNRKYTEEQQQMVKSILGLAKKGHYEVLSVSRKASETEIKKSYRKLALKIHPDKNFAPGAEDAFKAVSQAFSTLSDPEKKYQYDMTGEDDDSASSSRGHGMQRQRYSRRSNDDDVTVEDIFEMFFGTGGTHQRQRAQAQERRRRQQQQQQQQEREQRQRQRRQQRQNEASNTNNTNSTRGDRNDNGVFLSHILQLFPLLCLFVLYALGTVSDNLPYSLKRSEVFNVKKKTGLTHIVPDIVYYVDKNFDKTYGKDRKKRREVEKKVQKSYESFLRRRCTAERDERSYKVFNAQRTSSRRKREHLYKEAENMEMPFCTEYFDKFKK